MEHRGPLSVEKVRGGRQKRQASVPCSSAFLAFSLGVCALVKQSVSPLGGNPPASGYREVRRPPATPTRSPGLSEAGGCREPEER